MSSENRRTLVATLVAVGLTCWAVPAAADDAPQAEPSPTTTASVTPSATTPGPTATTPPPTTPPPTSTGPTPGPTPAPTPSPTDDDSGLRRISDAELRWGFNAESNRAAFAPGTFNFFSAGKIPDPGRGGQQLPQSAWRQSAGQVSIEKYTGGAYRKATWAGLSTGPDGQRLTTGSTASSGHQVVLDGGTGQVDREDGRATIRWKGSFTVLYYSGYTFFYVTDPVLTVTRTSAKVTATLSGFASSMDDLTQWSPVPATKVTLADLGRVDLGARRGVEVTPRYKGVRVSVGPDQTAQVRSGSSWGSFPQSFVDYQARAGAASYWYSSGGSADQHKPTSPLTVSWSAGDPIVPSAPQTGSSAEPDVSNRALRPPAAATSQLPGSAPAAAKAPDLADLVPPSQPTTTRPVSSVVASPLPDGPGDALLWWVGAVLLLTAAVVSLTPVLHRPRR